MLTGRIFQQKLLILDTEMWWTAPPVGDLHSQRRRLRSESRSRQDVASTQQFHSLQQPETLARSLEAAVGRAVAPSPT